MSLTLLSSSGSPSEKDSVQRENARRLLVRIVSAVAIGIILYGVFLLINEAIRRLLHVVYIPLLWTVYQVILALIIIYIGILLYRLRKSIPNWQYSNIKMYAPTFMIIACVISFTITTPILPRTLMIPAPPAPLPPFEPEDIFSFSEILTNRTTIVTIYDSSTKFDESHGMVQGDRVTLKILNEDNVTRAFVIDEFNISSGPISPKSNLTIEFIPNLIGSFKAYCPISGKIHGYMKVLSPAPISVVKRAAEIIADNVGIDYFMTYFKFKEACLVRNALRSLKGDLIDGYFVCFYYWVGIKNFETMASTCVVIGVDDVSVRLEGIPNLLEDPTKGMPYNIDQDDAVKIASTVLPYGVDGYHASFHFYFGDLRRYIWGVTTYLTDPRASHGEGMIVTIDPYSGEILQTAQLNWFG